jgi:DNA (cytosine-5)-methyltransferase 1
MSKPILLDMFCCAGGAAKGYMNAGFEVWGVDINPQPRYAGDRFFQDDALDFLANNWKRFDAIHASPPCQFASQMFCPTNPDKRKEHLNLIPATRQLLKAVGLPYVIENVKGARKHLLNPLMLHGSMFQLPIYRERFFEMSSPVYFVPMPRNDYTPVPVNSSSKEGNKHASKARMGEAMGIDWMTKAELRQAIPPAYTEFLGKQLLGAIK